MTLFQVGGSSSKLRMITTKLDEGLLRVPAAPSHTCSKNSSRSVSFTDIYPATAPVPPTAPSPPSPPPAIAPPSYLDAMQTEKFDLIRPY